MTDRLPHFSNVAPVDERIDAIRVIVADEHPIVLYGATKVIAADSAITVVATAGTVNDLYISLAQHPCDVLLCDLAFPKDRVPDGLRLLATIGRRHPSVKVLVFSMHDDPHIVRSLINGGAVGFLTKSVEDFTRLADIIRTVHCNVQYIDARTTQAMAQAFQGNRQSKIEGETTLSGREREVLRLLNAGWSVSEIADHLDRSRQTVSAQKKSAMRKLGVQNNREFFNAIKKMF
ncbi:response regulator [Burkholderia pyrrocinia]